MSLLSPKIDELAMLDAKTVAVYIDEMKHVALSTLFLLLPLINAFAPVSTAAANGEVSFADVLRQSSSVAVVAVMATDPAGRQIAMIMPVKGRPFPTDLHTNGSGSFLRVGDRYLLASRDPAQPGMILDPRDSVALLVAPDGTIDPSGYADAPARIGDIPSFATAALHTPPAIPPTEISRPADPSPGLSAIVFLVLAAFVALIIVATHIIIGRAGYSRRTRG